MWWKYSKFLRRMFLYKAHDGNCIILNNRKAFYRKIIPHLKHKNKARDALFLCKGNKDKIPKRLNKVLNYLEENPMKTQKEIAKALKKSKVYSELNLLKEFGFVTSESYPLKFKLNEEIKNISGD